jgi:hypothetical protein
MEILVKDAHHQWLWMKVDRWNRSVLHSLLSPSSLVTVITIDCHLSIYVSSPEKMSGDWQGDFIYL